MTATQTRSRFEPAAMLVQWQRYTSHANVTRENPIHFAQDRLTRELSGTLMQENGMPESLAMTIAGAVVDELSPMFQKGQLPPHSTNRQLEQTARSAADKWFKSQRQETENILGSLF